jgi:hypothetical protein
MWRRLSQARSGAKAAGDSRRYKNFKPGDRSVAAP